MDASKSLLWKWLEFTNENHLKKGWILFIPLPIQGNLLYLDVPLDGSERINGERINGLFHLLINGVYWGYNPLILTFDPNFLGHPSISFAFFTCFRCLVLIGSLKIPIGAPPETDISCHLPTIDFRGELSVSGKVRFWKTAWMSQEVSKWFVNGLYHQYIPCISRL